MKCHYVYKITNTLNNKIYIGKRSSLLAPTIDKYMGSGTALKEAIKKHGLINFKKEILKTFSTAKEAYSYERELLSPCFVLLESNYNIACGGVGGDGFIEAVDIHKTLSNYKRRKTNLKKLKKEYSKIIRSAYVEIFKLYRLRRSIKQRII